MHKKMQDLAWSTMINHDLTLLDHILKLESNVDTTLENGQTLLMWSVLAGFTRGYFRLLKLGADPKNRDWFGDNLLHHAASQYNEIDIWVSLLEWGLDLHEKNNEGDTPLHVLAQLPGDHLNYETLLDYGGIINIRNDEGMTPLMSAAEIEDNQVMMGYLLYRGADLNARDDHNKTALDHALMCSQSNADYLEKLEGITDFSKYFWNPIFTLARYYNKPDKIQEFGDGEWAEPVVDIRGWGVIDYYNYFARKM